MCGRFTQKTPISRLAKEFGVREEDFGFINPRYNVAPTDPVCVIRDDKGPKVDFMVWGLIPSWSKDPTIGGRMFNARAETITEKPSFKGPFKNSRCLVLADGFFEWRKEENHKQPYYVRLKSEEPFAFAGLWTHWSSEDGSHILSCTIITREANELMKPIHDRMPVILPKNKREQWIDRWNHDTKQLTSLLQAYPSDEMEAIKISTFVNSPTNDSYECIKPLEENESREII